MRGDRWQELDRILDQAMDLPAAERAAFLEGACPDPDERRRLAAMLDDMESLDGFLEPGGALGGDLGEEFLRTTETPPASIPGYALERRLGTGGMGEVWEAEQHEPVRRRVALKILRPSLDGDRVLRRFDAERQTLARMSHPGIAQIFDAGFADGGRPYFAMELVDGAEITAFCDANELGIRARLRLFVELGEAIEHAHRRGVIHRDLKPSNVLVAREGERAIVKVIDFGIAQIVDEAEDGASPLTEVDTVLGTPEYMSPEQAGESPGDIDTRADVYALGVLLFELLTGSLPHRRTSSSPVSLVSFLEEVRRGEVPLASVRVARRKDPEAARRRGESVDGLVRRLRHDLDWIVARALEKDRNRRYGSVGELLDEVQRFLHDEPVEAGPPRLTYRARKFVRRNRGAVVATGAVMVALVAGLVGTGIGLQRAQHEAERARVQADIARAVNTFLNEDLLAAVAPDKQGRDVTMQEVLVAAGERLDGRFAQQPEIEASLRATIGNTWFQLGKLDEASTFLEDALALRIATDGRDDPDALDVAHVLGELRFYQGRPAEAESLILFVAEGRERSLGPLHSSTISAHSDLGAVHQTQGDLVEAELHYRTAYERAQESGQEFDPGIVHNLGALSHELGRTDEAIDYLERAYAASCAQIGAENPHTLTTLSLLGSVYRESGDVERAAPIYREVLEARRRILGDEHPSTLTSMNNLGVLLEDLEDFEGAIRVQRETLAIKTRLLGAGHDATILSKGNLATALIKAARADEALPLLVDAVDECEASLGTDHPLCGSTRRKLGDALAAVGRDDEARAAYDRAIAVAVGAYGDDHPDVALARARRALVTAPRR